MGQDRGLADQGRRDVLGLGHQGGVQLVDRRRHAEGGPHRLDQIAAGGLVQADRHGVGVHRTQVDPTLAGRGQHLLGPARHANGDGVEEAVVDHFYVAVVESGGQDGREAVDPRGDAGQPFRAVVGGVQAGHDRQQDLGGADVAGGLLPADVLLTGLEREPVGPASGVVHRHPHQPPRQGALVGISGGDEAGVRAAEAQRHPEALRRPDDDVGPDLPGRAHQHQRRQIGGHGDQRPRLVRGLDQLGVIADHPAGARVLGQHTEGPGRQVGGRGDLVDGPGDHLQTQGPGSGGHHGQRLGVAVLVDYEDRAGLGVEPAAHGHGLGCGGGFVQQRGVGQLHAGQVAHHGLEVEQCLQPALGDLGLVGRVGRVPGRVLQHVAQDHGRGDGVGVAQADQRGEHLVAVSERPEPGQGLGFAQAPGAAPSRGRRGWLPAPPGR